MIQKSIHPRELQGAEAVGRKSVVIPGKNNDVLVTSGGLRKKEPTDSEWHIVEVPEMNGSFGVKLEGNETPRHQEKMLIIRCTVSGHHHDLITEHTACCSAGSWSIIHSQYLARVPPLQRSKAAESADRNTYCAPCLCVPHHSRALDV